MQTMQTIAVPAIVHWTWPDGWHMAAIITAAHEGSFSTRWGPVWGAFSLETKVSSASAVTICLNYLVPPLPHAMRQLFSSQHPTLLSTFIGYRHRIRMTTSFRLFLLGEFHPFTPNFGHRMDSSSAASLSNAITVSKNLKKCLKKYVKQTQIRMINNEVIAIKLSWVLWMGKENNSGFALQVTR